MTIVNKQLISHFLQFCRDDRQAYLNLQADCKDLSGKIAKLDGQCSVEMVKRFGEGVTMQDIESFAVNRTLEEMKELSKRKEKSLFDSINEFKVNIKIYQDKTGQSKSCDLTYFLE